MKPCHSARAPSWVGPAVWAYDCSSGSRTPGTTPSASPTITSSIVGAVSSGEAEERAAEVTGATAGLTLKAPHTKRAL